MSKRKKQPLPKPTAKSADLSRTVTSDMREFGELVAAAQSDLPVERLSELIDWHDEADSEFADDLKQKAKALLGARALLNGYEGPRKLVPRIGSGTASAGSDEASDGEANVENEPQDNN